MTVLTLLDRLQRVTKARSNSDLSRTTSLDAAEISRIRQGKRSTGMKLSTLDRIAAHTGVDIGTLATWWAEEPGSASPERKEE